MAIFLLIDFSSVMGFGSFCLCKPHVCMCCLCSCLSVALCRNHVLLEDVEYFLEKSKAKECFDMLDLDKDGKVSLQVRLTLPHTVAAHTHSCTLTHSPSLLVIY